MNSASLEMYHERMRDIQDVSETVAVANHQLNKLLQKFEWSRSHLRDAMKKGVVCSVDDKHVVKKDNLEKHSQKCFLSKLGIKSLQEKEITTSNSSNYYARSNTVVPVLLNEDHYKKAGVDFERLGIAIAKSKATASTIDSAQNNAVSLVEVDNAINSYIPTDTLDELRFIYSWNRIPQSYVKIDSTQISGQELDSWIKEHIQERLQNEFYHMLIKKHCQSLDHPDVSLELLRPVLGEDARQFVLNLWKFAAAKSLCRKQNISEHTRKEFDVYGMSSVAEQICSTDNKALGAWNASVLSQLPAEWSYYNLTREQKLKIYEEVCEIRNRLSVPALQFTELQADAEEQMKVLTSLEAKSGEKTKLEIMAEMRDYKRRRQSYRGKNKSNAKLTAIEVLREIVEQQMLYLDIVNGRNPSESADTKPDNERKEKSRSPERRRRSRSREKDPQRGRDRSKDRRRSRSRERKHRNRSRERRRNRSRSNDRKDRKYRRSSSREKDNRVVNDRRKKFTERNPQESARKRESKSNQYRERSPYDKRNSDREIWKPKEISNITYYDVD